MSESKDLSPGIRELTPAQQDRLATLLEQYLTAMEDGLPPSLDMMSAADPDLADALASCIAGLQNLHRLAAGDDSTPRPDNPIRLPGERELGDFILYEEIGRGGMGVIYRAQQRSLDRTVAIKLLPLASVLDHRQITRFRNEARAAATLNHPHIVPVFAIGHEHGVHYYAMQLIQGKSIDQVIAGHRAQRLKSATSFPDWREILSASIAVADGLHTAHEAGIIHRDVKPSNLILDFDGKLWITDFGLARCQRDVTLTGSQDIVGTARYMSPEQARGESAFVDGRTDIYSLAATLYEMLTLTSAVPGDDGPAILRSIDNESIIPITRLRSDLPRDLETVIQKAMSVDRDGRYESAQDFADDLQRILDGKPTVARPPTMIDRIAGWGFQHRNGVAAALLVSIVGLMALSLATAKIAAEKRISDANGARALRYEHLSRETVDRLGTQVAELLAEVPAADSVRRHLLTETLDYYERFVLEAVDDPKLQRDLAVTYGKIGALHDELGATVSSIDALIRSEQMYAGLVQTKPADRVLMLQWSISQNNLAEVLRRSGQLEQAAAWFAKAIAAQQVLLDQSDSITGAGADEIRVQFATTLNNQGLLLAEMGEIERAEQVYSRAVRLLTDVSVASHLVAAIHANLAGLMSDHSPQRAIEFAQLALRDQIDALEQAPGNAALATQVVLSLNTLGTAQAKLEKHRSAIDAFGQATDIARQLQMRWPDQPTYRRDLVMSLNHWGLSLAALGQRSNATDAFQQALEHQLILAKLFQSNAEVQSVLGGVMNNLGFLHQRAGRDDIAEQMFRQAVKQQALAIELAPEVAKYQSFLKKHKRNLLVLRDQS